MAPVLFPIIRLQAAKGSKPNQPLARVALLGFLQSLTSIIYLKRGFEE
jgi:hypothetical protein